MVVVYSYLYKWIPAFAGMTGDAVHALPVQAAGMILNCDWKPNAGSYKIDLECFDNIGKDYEYLQ